jgi:hypothetical protein
MPIIIDNFQVNINAPIDNRFVVGGTDSFYSNRDVIVHKYQGLRIWDLTPNNSGPYYWTGATWSSENSVGVLVDGSTEQNYIPRFSTGTTVLGKSLLYQTPVTNQIGIGISNVTLINPNTDLSSHVISASIGGLHTNGNIKTNGFLIGKADYITQLNVSNVNDGLLDIRYVSHLQSGNLGSSVTPGQQYVLSNTATPNGVSWLLANTLSVLNSTNTTNINIVEESGSNSHYITFVSNTGGQLPLKISSSKMQFKPDTGQLFLSDGSATKPVYSFLNNTTGPTGFYYNQGISTTIQGSEITSVKSYGLIVNNRIYIKTTSNNTDVGYGIVWSTNGPSNDININDGFVYNGQRLNFYGLGSHIPDNTNTQSTLLTGRGTYIAGYFGVDIFSGNKLKVKVDEYNDVSIVSRLNIYNSEILGNSNNANVVLSTMQNPGGLGNLVIIKDWSVRAANSSASDWLTWKHHNGITVDNVWATPNGPDKPTLATADSAIYGTLTFWERHPHIHEQYFGSVNRKTLTINSSSQLNQFVKVDGSLLVGTNTISPSAVADFTSTNKGIIPPRLTTTQRGTIVTPVAGLTIYNTTTKHMEVYDGTDWVGLSTTKVDYGSVPTTNRVNGQSYNDNTHSYVFIYPPAGYNISHLVGFLPSIEIIDFGGDVNNDDFLFCRYVVETANNRVRVWCNNSENDSNSRITYMAIYQK